MNFFDGTILAFFNQFSRQSRLVDGVLFFLHAEDLFKGGIFMVLFWWLWFAHRDQEETVRKNRRIILATFGGVFVALASARILQILLPFRPRPLHHPSLNLLAPYGVGAGLDSWSAFPSDHAALFVALIAGLWLISRRLGMISALYTVLVIFIPRIYLGFHYPTDLICGGILGGVCVGLVYWLDAKLAISGLVLDWSERHQALFYSAMFFWTFQIAELFDNVRHFLSAVHKFAFHLGG